MSKHLITILNRRNILEKTNYYFLHLKKCIHLSNILIYGILKTILKQDLIMFQQSATKLGFTINQRINTPIHFILLGFLNGIT